jgi:hypothetical protein
MNLNRLVWGLLFVLFVSCKQELKVIFPENIDNSDFMNMRFYEYIAIVYIKPEGCTSCAMSNLTTWKLYKNILNKHNAGILLIINSRDEQNITEILKSLDIKFPVVFDKQGAFKRLNDKIFKITNDGVFVIDQDDNVIFTGSPIATEEKWKSFVKFIGR